MLATRMNDSVNEVQKRRRMWGSSTKKSSTSFLVVGQVISSEKRCEGRVDEGIQGHPKE